MATARLERRLSAILAADVVGYSRLMERDEAGTFERLKRLRKDLIEPVLERYGGRFVDLKGDGAIVEFGSVISTVEAAVEIQRAMLAQDPDLPESERIRYRIGINLGDVIIDGDTIYGDGVNVAARIESLCEPGGVWLSRSVYNQVKGKVDLALVPSGLHQVKNISEAVETFRVALNGVAPAPAPQTIVARPRAQRWVLPTAGALFVLLLIAGGWWWHQDHDPARAGGSPLLAKTSLAVLPFANLSGDERWERFTDGITEDLITDLAQDSDLLVIARNSTQAYKGKAVDVRRVGQDLGVRYVLEGSLQVGTGRVRLTAQLIDATTGGHLWAERYDRPEEGLFAIQDEVAQKVAAALGGWYGRLNETRRGEAKRRPPTSLDAYDLYLLGTEQKHKFTRESMAEAIRLLSRAVELDPGFARAWGTLGVAYGMSAMSGFVDDPVAANASYVELIKKAVALDPNDSFTQAQMGIVRALEGDLKGAEAAWERALALSPNDAVTLTVVGWFMPLIVGRAEEAVRYGQRAMMLDPGAPEVHAPGLAIAQYVAGEYKEAVATMRRAPLEGGQMLMYWAMAQAQLGDAEEAHKAAERIRTEFPSFTVESYIRDFPVTAPVALAAIREGATKAGLMPVVTQ
jgi:TolB-like protein/class 3 adenylate cyclase/Flp pilus assembly protein TadD